MSQQSTMQRVAQFLNYFNCLRRSQPEPIIVVEPVVEEEEVAEIELPPPPPRRSDRLRTITTHCYTEAPAPPLPVKRIKKVVNKPEISVVVNIVIKKPTKAGFRPASQIIPFSERIVKSRKMFAENKKSDEYYTRCNTWERYIHERGLKGTTVFEPFSADGSSAKVLKSLVKVKSGKGDFWEQIVAPDCPQEFILSNPPFSFKWLILQTLLERKRSFALILPFQIFYGSSAKILDEYQDHYGGKWGRFILKGKENYFYNPDLDKLVPIGCSILEWHF